MQNRKLFRKGKVFYMENDLLCLIGEAVLLEVHGIKDVSYPMDEENACIVVTDENKRYKLTLEKLE